MTLTDPRASGRQPAADVTYIGDLMGSYLLSSRENHNGARLFGCRVRSVSPQTAVLDAPVKGSIGEKLALKLDVLGLLKARVSRLTDNGFAADLLLTPKESATIAARIDWLKQRRIKSLPDRRESKRWLPRDSRSSLILADSRQLDCLLIDISSSGAAISADAMPEIGHPVVIGAVLARVVRRIDCGFAVQFLTPLAPDQVETMVAPSRDNKRQLLAEALAEAEALYLSKMADATPAPTTH